LFVDHLPPRRRVGVVLPRLASIGEAELPEVCDTFDLKNIIAPPIITTASSAIAVPFAIREHDVGRSVAPISDP
jgi:hypothetical protein